VYRCFIISKSSHRLIYGARVGQHLVTTANKFCRVGLKHRPRIIIKRLKVVWYAAAYTRKLKQQRFTIRSGNYWLALALCSGAQLATTHCSNKWTWTHSLQL